ncbi:MAG: rod shape-determining protein MreD [Legionellaceae bacterium]|nr:rod shape-determining protein MreD [Legionellaceae bacterium]HAF87193.1 rod shape-determining protein MreD [Legionellales bacterium]HCA89843.1 rod shape-determining protein MreD [Legionellales bacterium]
MLGRILLFFIVMCLLTIIKLPSFLTVIKPCWILLLCLYIEFYIPKYFKLTLIVLVGIILDVLLVTVIGEHVLALVLVTWLAQQKARRFYFFTLTEQMIIIGFFVILYQGILTLIDVFLGFDVSFIAILGSMATSMLCWPWLKLLASRGLTRMPVY